MSGIKARAVIIRRNGTVLAGVKTKGITINGTPIDITTDDSAGIRQLMDDAGQVDVSIKVGGIVLSEQLRSAALSATGRVQQTEFIFPGFEGSPTNTHGFSGPFFLSSYSENGEMAGAMTWEGEFQSAGTVTYQAK